MMIAAPPRCFFMPCLTIFLALTTQASSKKNRATETTFIAPNFDSFVDKVSGSWRGPFIKFAEECPVSWRSPPYVWTVEEVMRPCGGAIQGIKEVQKILESGEELHEFSPRRNDDGFIFFDDGSFSLGPTILGASGVEFDYGFMFSTGRRTRFTVKQDNCPSTCLKPEYSSYQVSHQNKFSLNPDLGVAEPSLSPASRTLDQELDSLGTSSWEGHVYTCKSYTALSWINTRLKWECESFTSTTDSLCNHPVFRTHMVPEQKDESHHPLKHICCEPADGVWASTLITESEVQILAGCYCEPSRGLEAMLRTYRKKPNEAEGNKEETFLLYSVQRFSLKEGEYLL